MATSFERLFAISFDPMVIAASDGTMITVNPAFTSVLGWGAQEISRLLFWELVQPSANVEPQHYRWSLLHGHPIIFVESNFIHKNGETRRLRWSAYPDTDEEAIVIVLREVNDSDKENLFFELAAEASPTVILLVSQTNILYANRLSELVFGYRKEELIGKPVEILIPPQHIILHQKYRREFNQTPYLRLMGTTQDLTGLHKNGNIFPVDIGLNPVQTPDGLVVVCSIIDLTRKKETEQAIIEKIRTLEERISVLDTLSTTDDLTSLLNRRSLDIQIELQSSIAQKNKTLISFLLIDIDDFKSYNDSYGHLAGDEVLKHISQTMSTNLRRKEIITRYGGEEFGIILPESSAEDALHTAERLRKVIENDDLPHQSITVSIGCATLYPKIAADENEGKGSVLLQMADQALYHSKRNGKNRATHYDEIVLNRR